jgi:hypothetical protein
MSKNPPQNSTDTQQSEVHTTTGDASTSPTGEGDATTTRGQSTPPTDSPKLNPEPPSDVHIIRDETDVGGPLVIESTDPDLNPPHPPIDPFPTDGTPQIDPPVPKQTTHEETD